MLLELSIQLSPATAWCCKPPSCLPPLFSSSWATIRFCQAGQNKLSLHQGLEWAWGPHPGCASLSSRDSQRHPAQMLQPPQLATIDAKKLQLINHLKSKVNLQRTLLPNTCAQVLVLEHYPPRAYHHKLGGTYTGGSGKIIQQRKISKPPYVTHYHSFGTFWRTRTTWREIITGRCLMFKCRWRCLSFNFNF